MHQNHSTFQLEGQAFIAVFWKRNRGVQERNGALTSWAWALLPDNHTMADLGYRQHPTPNIIPLPIHPHSGSIQLNHTATMVANTAVWYFAYGSNMSLSKFTGSRGIHPIKVARAKLPGWTLTTEIPGTPYSEPAYTSIRPITDVDDEKTREVIGLAYLITAEQYVHLVASEGGGIAYADIAAPAIPATESDELITGSEFVVRTLGTILRRVPSSSPSARYMVRFSPCGSKKRRPC